MKCMKWLVHTLLIWRYLGKLTRDLVEDKPRQQDLVTSSCQRKRDYLRLSAWYSDTSPHVSPQCARSHWHFGPLSWFQPEMKDNSKQLSRNEENIPITMYPITTYHTESDHTRILIEHIRYCHYISHYNRTAPNCSTLHRYANVTQGPLS